MTGILEHLKWESLKKRSRDSRLILLYKGLKDKASIPTDDLIPRSEYCLAKPYRDILRYWDSVLRYVLNRYWIASKVIEMDF